MTDKTLDEQVEFFGKEFKLNEITNPHLQKVLTEGRAKGYNDHSRWSCWGDYTDWSQNYREKYHEHTAYADYNVLS